MAAYNDVLRIITSRALAVNSAGGAVTSTTSVSNQTRVVELAFPATPNSGAGMRFAISDMGADSITSTTGAFLPANWVEYIKVGAGTVAYVIRESVNGVLYVTEAE